MITSPTTLDEDAVLQALNSQKANLLAPAIAFTVVLMILGTIGNPIAIYIYGFKWQNTTTRVFLLCLAVLDSINSFIAMPTEIYLMAQFYYFPNAAYCSTSRFITYFINNATSAVFLFIAIDRYFRICRPYSWSFSIARAKMACVASLCIGAIVSWPALVFYGNKTVTFRADADVPLNVTGVLCNVRDGYENSLGPDVFFKYLWCAFIICAIILIVLYSFIGRSILRRRRKKKLRMKQQAGGSPHDRNVNASQGELGHVKVQPLGGHNGVSMSSNKSDAQGNGLLVGETMDAFHLIPLDVYEEHDDNGNEAVPPQQSFELDECGDVPEYRQHLSEHDSVQIAGDHYNYDVEEGHCPLIDRRKDPGNERDALQNDRHDNQTRHLGAQDEDCEKVLLDRDVENCVISKNVDAPEIRFEDLCYPNSDLSTHQFTDNPNQLSDALNGSQPVNQSLKQDNLSGLGDTFKHNSDDTPGERDAGHLNSQQPTKPVSGQGIPDSPIWVTSRTSHEPAAEDTTVKCVNGNCLSPNAWKSRIPKSTLMLFAITLVFVVSFLPFLVVISIRQQRGPEFYQRLSAAEEVLVHIFSRSYLVNNCANPIVYGLCNVQFRRQVKQLFSGAGRLCRMNVVKGLEGHKTT